MCLTLTLLLALPASARRPLRSGDAARTHRDTVPIKRSDIRELTTSAAYRGPAHTRGVTRIKNLDDGIAYTSWATGPAGANAWLNYQFVGTRYISGLSIIPGCAGSNRTYAEFGRPKTLLLQAGTRQHRISVVDRRSEQLFTIDPPMRASALQVRILDQHRGRLAGVCITELKLQELNALGRLNAETRRNLETAAAALGTDTSGAAVLRLIAMGPAAVPRLALALNQPNAAVQRDALRAFAGIGSPSAARALLRYWKAGPPAALLPSALKALARTGSPLAVSTVALAMQSEDFELADSAANLVGHFGPTIIPALRRLLQSPHRDVVDRTLFALRHVSAPQIVELIRPFCRASRSRQRAAAAAALGNTPSDASLQLLTALRRDPHPAVRVAVARALKHFKGEQACDPLAQLLRDRDLQVAEEALGSLVAFPNAGAYLEAYLHEETAPAGEDVILELAKRHSKQGLRVMVAALRRGESRFRGALRDGVLSYGQDGARILLEAALKDDHLITDARFVLARLANQSVSLLAGVVDKNPASPPDFVIEAIGDGHAPGSLAILDKIWVGGGSSSRLRVVEAWGHYPAAAVKKRLLSSLQSHDPQLRNAAAQSAAQVGLREAAPFFVDALTTGRLRPEIALGGLARLDDPRAEDYMVAHFDAARLGVRLAILRACRALQTPACLRILYGATNDKNESIRYEAMQLLADSSR